MPSDSMNIGITGLDAYQAQIDVISNNIANVGTTAYKGQSLSFQDLLYQTQQPGSGPTKTSGGVNYQQIGIGVKIGATDTNPTQGGVQTTGVTTNMMINGDGYFMLKNADGTGNPKYTRNGDFSLNANGLLFDPSSGQAVMGYSANAAGNILPGAVGPITVPIGLKELATATGSGVKQGPAGDKMFSMSWGGNLDSTQYAAAVSLGGTTPPAASFVSAGTTIYDSLGDAHLVTIAFHPQISAGGVGVPMLVTNAAGAAVTAATEWAYTMTATDGTLFNQVPTTAGATVAPSATSSVQYVFFDAGGQFINTSGMSVPPAGFSAVHQAAGSPSFTTGDQLTVAQWGTPANSNNSTSTPTGVAAPSGPIGIDFSNMTANASSAQVVATYQDGYAPGTLDNMTVGADGTITGTYTNGQSVALAQVAVATFQNEAGLLRTGGSDYVESVSSGEAQVGTANTGRYGSITGNALELSNVSIGDEFTKLITAQNAFTANSKSITTANADDQTVINLIR